MSPTRVPRIARTVLLACVGVFGLLQSPIRAATAHPTSSESQPNSATQIVYRNRRFGFCFQLPASWAGFSIVKETWSGGPPGGTPAEHGPLLRIRNPKWTKVDPHEDIPIMVFTRAQWKLVEDEQLVVSAAPVGPKLLGKNAHYVFALPPRYNFDQLTGFEEVDQILSNHPLHAPCRSAGNHDRDLH